MTLFFLSLPIDGCAVTAQSNAFNNYLNKDKGIVYHYEGQLVGDYDKCQTEEEIIEMIKTGK